MESSRNTEESIESKLFPRLPKDYFKRKANPFKKMYERKDGPFLKPSIRITDLNEGDGKRKSAVVVGVKGSF